MSRIQLDNQFHPEVTILPNEFIDHYMPSANGAFVKVYLYLLRYGSSGSSPSVSEIAETLDETEKDILRALRYWEKKQLLSLTKDPAGAITGIAIHSPVRTDDKKPEPASDAVDLKSGSSSAISAGSLPEPVALDSEEYHRPKYSDAQISQLKELGEVQFLLNAVERYLERLLKPGDLQLVLFLYEGLGFSTDLILYLYEYCISMNKKNASYIESVALAWDKEGIDTVEKAENASILYNTVYQAVNKAFGLNRVPGNVEKQFLYRWMHTYKFESLLIEEACNRSLLATGKPDFKYADKILENWHNQGVKTLSDIVRLDEKHAKQTSAEKTTRPFGTTKPAPGNKFNAFPQREYTQEDFDNLERRLLNKKK